MEALLTNVHYRKRTLYLRPPSQNPGSLNSDTNSVFSHSPRRSAPVSVTFFASRGCPLMRASGSFHCIRKLIVRVVFQAKYVLDSFLHFLRVLPYISHIGVCRPKGYGFALFWSENGHGLCPFWSGIGYGFRGNYRNVWRYLSFQFQMSKKERKKCEFEMDFKKFCRCSYLSNDEIIS